MFQLLIASVFSFALNNVSLMPTEVYIINGFDNNDSNVQLAFDSFYPDSCYDYLPTEAKVDEKNKKIYINNQSIHRSDMICAKAIRYFDDIVNLGPISTIGEYAVYFQNRNGEQVKSATLKIKKPDNQGSTDDVLYAPVQEVNIVRQESTTFARLFIKSHSTCIKIKSVTKELQGNVLVVMPEIENYINSDDCGINREPVTLTHDVSLDGITGKILLHIRAMNGKAISRFVEL